MEVRLGNIFGYTGGNYAGNVYDKNFMCPTLNTMQGGCKQPMIIDEVRGIGNIYPSGGQNGNVYSIDGISPTLLSGETSTKGNGGIGSSNAPKIMQQTENQIIVAMRGRNPDNPSDRTVGSPTEQRLEPNSQGICNTLTSVQKDNLVMETVRIKQATSQGYIECEVGGVADLSFPDSKTRRGRVQENGQVSPTLMAGEQDICRIETYSPYVNQKYKEFQEKNGYIPEYFNPYNKTELTDVAPTLTAQGESITKSSTILKCDTQYRIRKLTPLECWRLMDFTDEDFENAAQVNSNTQLYKQAGNSIVNNVLVAILGQMIPGKEDVYKKLETR